MTTGDARGSTVVARIDAAPPAAALADPGVVHHDAPQPARGPDRHFRPEFEALRGIAMLPVLFFHLHGLVTGPLPRLTPQSAGFFETVLRTGFSTVDLFFVLSAYLLAQPFLAAAAGERSVSLWRYAARRALRIMPLYYAAVAIGIAATAGSWTDCVRRLPYFAFLHPLAPPMRPYSVVWWTLFAEVQFYILLPFLPIALRSARTRRVAGAIVAAYVIAYAAYLAGVIDVARPTPWSWVDRSLFTYAPVFAAGVAAAAIARNVSPALRDRLAAARWLRNGGGDLALFALVVAVGLLLNWVLANDFRMGDRPPYQLWHTLDGMLWAAILLLLVLVPMRARGLLASRPLLLCGTLSYAVYLVHWPLLRFGFRALAPLGVRAGAGWSVQNGVAAVVLTAACFAVAAAAHRGIERPFLRWKERLGRD